MIDIFQAILGLTALGLTFGGLLVGAFRSLSTRMSSGNKALYDKMDSKHSHLDNRIDRIKEDYVRRVDLDGHLQRVEKGIEELRNEQKSQNAQVLTLLSSLVSATTAKDKK